jgi:hypothetical protein
MPDEKKQWYEVVKHNSRNPDDATTKVVDTVRGRGHAETRVDILNDELRPEEKEAGLRHFLRKGRKPEGGDLQRSRQRPNTRPNWRS